MLSSTLPISTGGGSSGLVFLSVILFVVAVALIAKIIYSNRKRRSDLIGGTARWRLAASQQSGAGPQQTAASYAPMGGARQMNGTNGLDTPGPDRLDWERQFFDDTEATVSFAFMVEFFYCSAFLPFPFRSSNTLQYYVSIF
ncbi:hypothetical protein ANCDUO_25652 [Ancylostoma duodenale]|uniref:Uncharacterized protein n=1 Tax=Ancylostoma duodenale TaxID=51022 RepID=A0A0C2BKP8_9BILA|nr:hypothetical protein ANCDUO_25652 [Ancylostoma duodenale]